MNKRIIIGLMGLMIAGSTIAATYTRLSGGDESWSVTNQWRVGGQAAIDLPGVNDNVVINSGRAVTADTDATVNQVIASNGASDGTITVDATGKTLATSSLYAGHTTGAGLGAYNHLAGSVAVSGSTILGSASGGAGIYTLTGGDLTVSGATTINSTGLLDVNGGTFSINNGPANITVGGTGLLKLQSGRIETTGSDDTDVLTLGADVEVSGGVVDLLGQTRVNGRFDIIGDAATIDIARLSGTGGGGTLNFVFGATGVSTIDVAAWMTLSAIDLEVDGSAYTGSETSFVLLDAVNNTANLQSYNITGFGTEGVDWELVQTLGTGGSSADVVLNVIPEPATLGLVAAFGGGMLFIRRMFQM